MLAVSILRVSDETAAHKMYANENSPDTRPRISMSLFKATKNGTKPSEPQSLSRMALCVLLPAAAEVANASAELLSSDVSNEVRMINYFAS